MAMYGVISLTVILIGVVVSDVEANCAKVAVNVSPRRYWPFSLSDEWTGKESGFYMSTAGTIASNASSFFVKYNNRAYLTNSCQGNSWDPNQFTKIRLLDQRITVTVDLSQIGCGCNLALYLVSMPGHSDGGKHEPDYYCDANDVGGVWCPEMDLLEANNMAMSITPHKCDTPQNGVYHSCDRGGCSRKVNGQPNNMGYGPHYLINTQYPFRVSWNFKTTGEKLSEIVTTLTQGSHQVNVIHGDDCGGGYLAALTDAFKSGMVLTVSYWSGNTGADMSWLDVPPCNIDTACYRQGVATFSNLEVNSL